MFKRILLGVLLFATVAGADQVFVRNKPFKGEVTSVSGQVFVDLKSLAEALEVKYTPSEAGGFVVGREPATPEQLAQAGSGQVLVAGQVVETQAGASGNLLVPLKAAAELLGARVTPNKQLGSIDVTMAPSKAKVGLGAGVRTINTPGAAVDVTAHLSPGIMNVVEFTAPW